MLLVAVILWGTAIAPTKWTLESIQPFTLLFIRLFFAGGICMLFSFKELQNQLYIKVPWKRMSLLAFTGVAGYFMFTSYGISNKWITCEYYRCCITISYNSFFSTLFERENSIELLDRNYIGCYRVLLITIPSKSVNQEVSLIGDILILLSTFLFAFYKFC